jgi:hypothetical protein
MTGCKFEMDTRDDTLYSNSLDTLIEAAFEMRDSYPDEDIVIWSHERKRVAAIVHPDGTETIIELAAPDDHNLQVARQHDHNLQVARQPIEMFVAESATAKEESVGELPDVPLCSCLGKLPDSGKPCPICGALTIQHHGERVAPLAHLGGTHE